MTIKTMSKMFKTHFIWISRLNRDCKYIGNGYKIDSEGLFIKSYDFKRLISVELLVKDVDIF